jgi:predicted nucleotidyltransferase
MDKAMASAPAEYMDFLRRAYGCSRPAEDLFRERLERLDGIVDALRANPLASCMRVFGSAAANPDQIPGDIDIFVDFRSTDAARQIREQALSELLLLAVAGGYHGNYGSFDPFVLNRQGVLYCRNGGPTRYSVGWQKAGRAQELIAAGRAGIPLPDFTRRFQKEFLEDQARPTP